MKIAYLFGSLPRGGAETLLLDCFKHSKETNLNIIGIYRKDGLLSDEFHESNIRLIKLRPRYIFDLMYFFKLRKLLNTENIDIVHAQQPIDALFAYIACFATGIKIILSIHGYDYNNVNLSKQILSYIIKRTDLNIFVSRSQRKYYQSKYSLKLKKQQKVIYNGISFNKFQKFQSTKLRNEINISDKTLLLGSVGNFVSVRDQITICKFLNLLNKNMINFAFVFVGTKSNKEPNLYDDCVNYCKENNLINKVFFLGSRNDVPNILNQLDAFIYASNSDTFGIAVIEALFMKTPVFVNDWEVMKEITENGKHGILYKSKNINDLFEKFSHYIENKEYYLRKAEIDSAWVKEKFDIITHLSSLEKTYTNMLLKFNDE